MRRDFEEMVFGDRDFAILCRDTEKGALPFLVAECETYDEDFFDFDNPDDEGVVHVFSALPVPRHFGLTDSEGLLELSPCRPNDAPILQKFLWCVLTPVVEGPSGAYELRFATLTMEDAEFVADHFCCDPLIAPITDSPFVVV